MPKPTGGYVFPAGSDKGLTRRQYLAALAMQARMTAWPYGVLLPGIINDIAKQAYQIADAMLFYEAQDP